MQKIFCPECGEPHESEGKFCTNCGANLEEVILRYKQQYLPIRYQAVTQSGNNNQGKAIQKKSGSSTAALVFGILTLVFGGAEVAILAIGSSTLGTLYIPLAIVFGSLLLISLVTVSVLSNCCSGSNCSGCDGSGCSGCGDCADCASGCDCSGCDISC